MCVLPIYLSDSPSDQGETFAWLCGVFGGLHFFPAIFFCPSKPTGVTQEGANTGAFSFFVFFSASPPSAVFTSIFLFEKDPAVPSLVDSNIGVCQLKKLFGFYRFRPPATKVREKPLSPRFEPVKWLPEGCVDSNQTTGATLRQRSTKIILRFTGVLSVTWPVPLLFCRLATARGYAT